jgi:hypothetical protein
MALGTSASTFGTAPVVAAADELPLGDAVGLLLELLELLEHPAATSVVIKAVVSAPAAIFLGRRRAAGSVALVRLFPTWYASSVSSYPSAWAAL